ncbi:MAG TPA: hypothetical protein VFJ77_12400, partial [Gaiellaceae bacterium]|nr:hypothetical protein [Gaiellaceae bacterium]
LAPVAGARRRERGQPPSLEAQLDHRLLDVREGELPIRNVDRAVGALLSYHVVKHGLETPRRYTFRGSAGQSFGAWLAPGIELTLAGEANDYVGKGLSGGVLAVRPPEGAGYVPERSTIVGNTVLYGATAGRAFLRGLAGERFAVRNSGARAVVEGVGDHGCEYMTGGVVVVLGPTGRNFAAGMSGGVAYVLDEDGGFAGRCNRELVGLEPVADDAELRPLVEEHLARTGSSVAARLLADWEPARFVRVLPHDYRRALELEAVSTGGEGFLTTETETETETEAAA